MPQKNILIGHLRNKYFLIDDKKISAIVSSDGADLRDYKVINLRGHYMMPGLINMHVHFAGNGKSQKKQQDNEKKVKMIMRLQ